MVDDDRGIRELLRRGLLLAGFDVVLAAGGVEGLQRIGTDPSIQLVLLDLEMPVIDGRAFREVQLADARLAAIPTVIVSAAAITPELQQALQAADYIAKPFNRTHLIAVVSRYCRPIGDAALPLSEPARYRIDRS